MTTKRPGEPVSMSLFFEFERRGWLRGLPGGQEFEACDEARASLGEVAVRGWDGVGVVETVVPSDGESEVVDELEASMDHGEESEVGLATVPG
jgi:hypothetical protein